MTDAAIGSEPDDARGRNQSTVYLIVGQPIGLSQRCPGFAIEAAQPAVGGKPHRPVGFEHAADPVIAESIVSGKALPLAIAVTDDTPVSTVKPYRTIGRLHTILYIVEFIQVIGRKILPYRTVKTADTIVSSQPQRPIPRQDQPLAFIADNSVFKGDFAPRPPIENAWAVSSGYPDIAIGGLLDIVHPGRYS